MTPKEKAKELINRYFLEIEGADTYAFNLPSMNLFIAKKCALIALDEMYNIAHNLDDMATVGYLIDVKNEIEKA